MAQYSVAIERENDSGDPEEKGTPNYDRKIKADGTLWVRSAGQALVCTLLGAAPSPGLDGAARRGKASMCRVFRGTLRRNRRFLADRRP